MSDYTTPQPPAGLDEPACQEWSRITQLRKFSRGETTLLHAYIRSWQKWQDVEAKLAVEGPTIQQPVARGRFKTAENPLVIVASRYQRQTLSAARQLKLHKPADVASGEHCNPFLHLADDNFDLAAAPPLQCENCRDGIETETPDDGQPWLPSWWNSPAEVARRQARKPS
jgi:phage terminase small subunit